MMIQLGRQAGANLAGGRLPLLAGGKRALSTLLALDEEFPCVTPLAPTAPADPGACHVSTLKNGVRVCSQPTGGAAASFGVMLSVGSRDEKYGEAGCTLLLQNLAFKTSTCRSALRFARDLEDAAAYSSASSGRESTLFQIQGTNQIKSQDLMELAVSALGETVLSPQTPQREMKETLEKTKAVDLAEAHSDAQILVNEAIHQAAFDESSPLGHSFFSPCNNPSALAGFRSANVHSHNITLVAQGVAHQDLVAHAERVFGGLSGGFISQRAASPYEGGEVRVPAISPATHLTVALEGVGTCSKDAPAFGVLKQLLISRVKDIAASQGSLLAAGFGVSYMDTGLIGVSGALPNGADVAALQSTISKALKSLSSTPSPAEVEGAKAANKLELLQSLMDPKTGLSSLYYGAVTNTAAVNGVTAQHVAALGQKLLQSKVSLAVVGDIHGAPRAAAIAKSLQ